VGYVSLGRYLFRFPSFGVFEVRFVRFFLSSVVDCQVFKKLVSYQYQCFRKLITLVLLLFQHYASGSVRMPLRWKNREPHML